MVSLLVASALAALIHGSTEPWAVLGEIRAEAAPSSILGGAELSDGAGLCWCRSERLCQFRNLQLSPPEDSSLWGNQRGLLPVIQHKAALDNRQLSAWLSALELLDFSNSSPQTSETGP